MIKDIKVLADHFDGRVGFSLVYNRTDNIFTVIVDFVNSSLVDADYCEPYIKNVQNLKRATKLFNSYSGLNVSIPVGMPTKAGKENNYLY